MDAGPLPSRVTSDRTTAERARSLRAFGVALVWTLSGLPVLLGRAGCPFAAMTAAPCPGCGMTRAVLLLAKGQIGASLQMHPLALPSAFASLAFMAATVWVTARHGSPEAMWRDRLGRMAILVFGGVEAAVFALWVARWFGAMGGPVPV